MYNNIIFKENIMLDKLGRKTIWTMGALIVFLVVMIINPNIDPLMLGSGIGVVLAGPSAANAVEHKAKNGNFKKEGV